MERYKDGLYQYVMTPGTPEGSTEVPEHGGGGVPTGGGAGTNRGCKNVVIVFVFQGPDPCSIFPPIPFASRFTAFMRDLRPCGSATCGVLDPDLAFASYEAFGLGREELGTLAMGPPG